LNASVCRLLGVCAGTFLDEVIIAAGGTSVEIKSVAGVKIDVSATRGIMGVAVAVQERLHGQVAGLYGDFDSNPGNDFVGADGKRCAPVQLGSL